MFQYDSKSNLDENGFIYVTLAKYANKQHLHLSFQIQFYDITSF